MKKEELERMQNSMNDTYLEEIINEHYEQTEEDLEMVNRVLEYRKMSIPLRITVKDHHYATMFRKQGYLPQEIMFDEKYVHIELITNKFYVNKELAMEFLVVLTRATKVEKQMGKINSITCMDLRQIYNHYLKDNNYMGIMIYGPEYPYPVSMERIEKILNIEEGEN